MDHIQRVVAAGADADNVLAFRQVPLGAQRIMMRMMEMPARLLHALRPSGWVRVPHQEACLCITMKKHQPLSQELPVWYYVRLQTRQGLRGTAEELANPCLSQCCCNTGTCGCLFSGPASDAVVPVRLFRSQYI